MRYQFSAKDCAKGGKNTTKKYGKDYMKKLGKRGRKKQLNALKVS